MAIVGRQHVIEQAAAERARNFKEVSLGFSEELMLIEAKRCLNCKHAPCKNGCPVGVDIPAFITALKENEPEKACGIIKQTNALPAVCGRVCPQEVQCEKYCVRQKSGGAVAIGALERYAADYTLKKGFDAKPPKVKLPYTAAIIGSGPAGLSCAGELANAGMQVTVFEAFHKTGGVLVYGIPEFRLPKDLVQQEIDMLKGLGVEFKLNTVVGKTVMLSELKKQYDYIFIGSGAGLPVFMKIKGENLCGVYSANEFLTRVNLMKAYEKGSATPLHRGKNVVVVGAGNVAMDAARTALRLGAENVKIVYRRSRAEMPAREEEIRHAEEEGVELFLLTNPTEVLGENGKVTGIRCEKMQLGEPDASGRRRPVAIEGSAFDMECDQVIMSIGTNPNPLIKDSEKNLVTSRWGTIVVNEKNLTSMEKVYAGGDAVTGAATVILAMGAGKVAADAILEEIGVR